MPNLAGVPCFRGGVIERSHTRTPPPTSLRLGMASIETPTSAPDVVKSLGDFVRVSGEWQEKHAGENRGMLSDLWYRGVNARFELQSPGVYRESFQQARQGLECCWGRSRHGTCRQRGRSPLGLGPGAIPEQCRGVTPEPRADRRADSHSAPGASSAEVFLLLCRRNVKFRPAHYAVFSPGGVGRTRLTNRLRALTRPVSPDIAPPPRSHDRSSADGTSHSERADCRRQAESHHHARNS